MDRTTLSAATPTGGGAGERLATLDTVRGVAVMGILLLNIVSFGMPHTAYMNPRAYGGAQGIDLAVYLVNFVLFDGRMRGLFSFLFGASMLLVINRAMAKGESPARMHYSRMAWLLLFGLAHLWLVWSGDILTHYAIIGMVAFAFRNMPISRLLAAGLTLLIAQMTIYVLLDWSLLSALGNLAAADPDKAARAAGTVAQLSGDFGIPSSSDIAAELARYRGGYSAILTARWHDTEFAPIATLYQIACETLAYMLFGMAGLRSGMLAGAWPRARYRQWARIGFGVSLPAYAAIAAYMVASGFSVLSVFTGVVVLTTPFRPAMIVGWACLAILAMRPGGAISLRVAAAGRMAFTNYLVTSLICTTLFYGYGLGMFGSLQRAQLYLVVLGVWLAMLIWSKPWLDRFAYGPFEWLWRSAARMRLQPFVRRDRIANASQ